MSLQIESRSLDSAVRTSCDITGWKAQFGRPHGFLGPWIGRLMAFKNRSMNRLAVDLLAVAPTDRILEIGFAHGVAVRDVATRATGGVAAGIDLSETMLKQATRRNRRAIAEGTVDLRIGDVAALPWPDDSFDKVFEVNSLHHWTRPDEALSEIRRVLRPDGALLSCLRMRAERSGPFTAPGYSDAEVGRASDWLRRAGFGDVRVVEGVAGRRVSCLLAGR